jgi:protein-S-isoprenylcysteine O-methyltransferase Ste14
MKYLEHRIPPPIVMLVTLGFIYLISRVDDTINLSSNGRLIGSAVLLLSGLAIALSGASSFRKARTTVNPLKPESASQLVTGGIFRVTRNPMYVGLMGVALAAVCFASSLWSLVAVLALFLYLQRFQITPEERAMQKLFGQEYANYCKQVRRWL